MHDHPDCSQSTSTKTWTTNWTRTFQTQNLHISRQMTMMYSEVINLLTERSDIYSQVTSLFPFSGPEASFITKEAEQPLMTQSVQGVWRNKADVRVTSYKWDAKWCGVIMKSRDSDALLFPNLWNTTCGFRLHVFAPLAGSEPSDKCVWFTQKIKHWFFKINSISVYSTL